MDVYWIGTQGFERRSVEDLTSLLARDDGFVWVDAPEGATGNSQIWQGVFGFDSRAIRACTERSLVPKVQATAAYLLLILHIPEPVGAGRTYSFELGLFLGQRYLVTIHERPQESLPPGARRVITGVRERVEQQGLQPGSPAELAHAVVSALIHRTDSFVIELATEVTALERRVLGGERRQPEQLLEAMFLLRHKLLAVRTQVTLDREVTEQGVTLMSRTLPSTEGAFIADLVDQFDRTRVLCDAELGFLQGVIDFYQTQTNVKMNLAMERLALISAIVLPITAVASIYGMNLIVSDQTQPVQLGVVLAVMAGVSAVMLWWARRQGWW